MYADSYHDCVPGSLREDRAIEARDNALERAAAAIYGDEDRLANMISRAVEAAPPALGYCDHETPASALATVLLTLREAYRPLNNLPFANTETAMRDLRVLVADADRIVDRIVSEHVDGLAVRRAA